MSNKHITDERAAFEDWARPNGYDLRRNDVLGHYSSLDTSRAWSGFRAGIALRPAAQPASAPAAEPICPACNGSGEGAVLSGGGPDAYDVACVCQTCNGHGLVSCERTHLLPGWQTSKGANLEVLNSLVLGNAITLEPGAEPVKPAAVLEFLGKLFDLDMIDLNGSLK